MKFIKRQNGFSLIRTVRKNLVSANGFSLIELIIVVAIIALLIVLVILMLLKNVTKANDAKRKADISKISTALEEYYTDHNCYPDPSIFTQCGGNGLQPYLQSIPCDPLYKYPYCYFAENASPTVDCYQKYRALTTLKNLADPDIKALGCDNPAYCGWEAECGATYDRFGFNYGISSRNTFLANPNAVVVPIGTYSILPTPGPIGPYACAWDGVCNNFGTSQQAISQGCPITFSEAGICQTYCDYSKGYWCPKP